jgi:hypothetical protein
MISKKSEIVFNCGGHFSDQIKEHTSVNKHSDYLFQFPTDQDHSGAKNI